MKIKEKKEICKLVELVIGIALEGIGSQYNCHITMDGKVSIKPRKKQEASK